MCFLFLRFHRRMLAPQVVVCSLEELEVWLPAAEVRLADQNTAEPHTTMSTLPTLVAIMRGAPIMRSFIMIDSSFHVAIQRGNDWRGH